MASRASLQNLPACVNRSCQTSSESPACCKNTRLCWSSHRLNGTRRRSRRCDNAQHDCGEEIDDIHCDSDAGPDYITLTSLTVCIAVPLEHDRILTHLGKCARTMEQGRARNTSTTRMQNPGLAAKIHNRVFSYGWNRLDESFSEMYTCPMLR